MLPPGDTRAPGRVTPSAQRTMPTRLHLKPGQNGAKPWLAQYGDRRICVCYRYDPPRQKRLKTVEPRRPPYADDPIVGARISVAQVAVPELAKQGGGRWKPGRKVWELPYRQAVALKLATRIVKNDGIHQ